MVSHCLRACHTMFWDDPKKGMPSRVHVHSSLEKFENGVDTLMCSVYTMPEKFGKATITRYKITFTLKET